MTCRILHYMAWNEFVFGSYECSVNSSLNNYQIELPSISQKQKIKGPIQRLFEVLIDTSDIWKNTNKNDLWLQNLSLY
jgi:hypothetical protein